QDEKAQQAIVIARVIRTTVAGGIPDTGSMRRTPRSSGPQVQTPRQSQVRDRRRVCGRPPRSPSRTPSSTHEERGRTANRDAAGRHRSVRELRRRFTIGPSPTTPSVPVSTREDRRAESSAKPPDRLGILRSAEVRSILGGRSAGPILRALLVDGVRYVG